VAAAGVVSRRAAQTTAATDDVTGSHGACYGPALTHMEVQEERLPRGLLVVFEGIDGAGKTTQAELFAERVRQAGLRVVTSKEPTTGPHGRALRESASTGRFSPEEELELFIADRRMHVAELVAPALARGEVVVVDRYYFSTAAYQGARGLDVDALLARNEAFAPAPDLLVILDIDVRDAVGRIASRDGRGNLFERAEDLARCAAIFKAIERPYLRRLDGTQSVAALHQQIVSAFDRGPLCALLCHQPDAESCAPEHRAHRIEQSTYPHLETLRPSARLSAERLNAIAADPSLTPAQRLERMRALLRAVRG